MSEEDISSLPAGASGEEILRQMLPVLVEAVTKSAEGQTASAAASQALETQISELRSKVEMCHAEMKRIADAKVDEQKKQETTQLWLQSLIKPETLYYTVIIILTATGFRFSLVNTPGMAPIPVPLPEAAGDLP